jgi:nucleoside-diphosphate-sugar epimerase
VSGGGRSGATALVIGGTGPTGPDVVEALLERSFEVTVLHRGLHEPADAPVLEHVEHLHADPHFREPLLAALAGRSFDVVLAMYGRMALNAEVCAGRCERFVSVGGNPSHRGHLDRRTAWPEGMRILADERSPTATGDATSRQRFAQKVLEAERAVMAAHHRGAFSATHLRYPMIYGTRATLAFERWLVRRLLDGRRQLLLPDGGLSIFSRCANRNAAAFVAGVLDQPEVTAGQIYQCADDEQFSLEQWTQMICAAMGIDDAEVVPVPLECARPVWPLLPTGPLASRHTLVDTGKARRDFGYADVVRPADALRALVELLVTDPSATATVPADDTEERVVIAAYERFRATLTATLGWEPVDEPIARWHPYDHPKEPSGE